MNDAPNQSPTGTEALRRPQKIETGRICAVCGKRTSPSGQKDTYGFKTILSRNEIAGDKAHRECVDAAVSSTNREAGQ